MDRSLIEIYTSTMKNREIAPLNPENLSLVHPLSSVLGYLLGPTVPLQFSLNYSMDPLIFQQTISGHVQLDLMGPLSDGFHYLLPTVVR
ncbi:hypothetical protein J437_LFUL013882 [Ladona fulva]|uniref:Uncharacterized protein n=1 Tax=Ladona fulva TaxID=123851 RepID=A0A8K0KI66_LADFU|nr:hypothetical protein J437_LFUL013882 [Ladona fulva]